ncbi:hypothetical protein SAMN04488096_105107 [Mesonia phycicola]|uniref:Outer membrane protein beta-barrel domain-containing protein n=1 Tax=Mesonia phycicola TaxID=579105 RepID=A0A1M6EJC2_9FLAO|nr:hypothetical protein [Mesonia phycicola]SHI85388.1 hypothetical protein SAMN04488096_105107 [Mesonia phycicola]
MKKLFSTSLLLLSFITTIAQIKFEPGYVIINNKKISCLIENKNWQYSPETIKYKFSENGNVITGNLNTIQGFGDNEKTFKYIKASVDIDLNSNEINNLSVERRAILQNKVLFLNTLIEGQISLYQYQNDNLVYFYYQENKSSNFIPLIYKKFISSASQSNGVKENNRYKNDLANVLKCDGLSESDFTKLDYNKEDLITIFEDYHECKYENYNTYETNKDEEGNLKNVFNFTFKVGASSHNIDHQDVYRAVETISFNSTNSYSFGLEFEIIFPYNGGKWSVFVESLYQNLDNETLYEDFSHEYSGDYRRFEVNNKYLQNSLGVRRRFFISNDFSVFVNGLFSFNANLGNSLLTAYNDDNNEELYRYNLSNDSSFGIGGGVNYKNFRAEVRLNSKIDFLNNEISGTSLKQATTSFILGYTLF